MRVRRPAPTGHSACCPGSRRSGFDPDRPRTRQRPNAKASSCGHLASDHERAVRAAARLGAPVARHATPDVTASGARTRSRPANPRFMAVGPLAENPPVEHHVAALGPCGFVASPLRTIEAKTREEATHQGGDKICDHPEPRVPNLSSTRPRRPRTRPRASGRP